MSVAPFGLPVVPLVNWMLIGGEQQMLAIGRALMADATLMMLDEPSRGLAPLVVSEVLDLLVQLNSDLGLTILLVEQNVRQALTSPLTDNVLERGLLVAHGPADVLRDDPRVQVPPLGQG